MPDWTAVRLAPRLHLFVLAEHGALRRAAFGESASVLPPGFEGGRRNDEDPVLQQARQELEEYASGKRRKFEVPFELEGTRFQCDVWKALFEIPFGEVRTYGDLARYLGRPGAARAVGAAAGRNPLPVIIPCHRLIGSGGALTGFSGGLEVKKKLLELEGAAVPRR
ncbi:MAG: methylated-DNA--[protein]-cysteine S-methyltransferase [Acidobacteriota bacterium]